MFKNPFIFGNRVEASDFFDREAAIRKTVGRLVGNGQSTLITGEPRTGKSSLLGYITAQELYPRTKQRRFFSYVDIDALGSESTAAGFWTQALAPLERILEKFSSSSSVASRLDVCKADDYSGHKVERLVRALKDESWQLVVLIDEMDRALHHEGLNNAAFFGGLRSVASRGGGALAVVLASRLSQKELDARTQVLSPSAGSPFFNIYRQVTLGPFPAEHVEALLDRAGERFTEDDRGVIRAASGGHPFLLQATASAMWEAYDEQIENPKERHQQVRKEVYREHKSLFADTWRNWTPEKRKTFTAVALAHTSQLLPERNFLSDAFVADLRDYSAELDELDEAGHVAGAPEVLGGWCVAAEAMLWWLTDELVRSVRTEKSFEEWLRSQELDRFLTTQEERGKLATIVRGVTASLGRGTTSLVESFAKGLGSGLGKGVGGG